MQVSKFFCTTVCCNYHFTDVTDLFALFESVVS